VWTAKRLASVGIVAGSIPLVAAQPAGATHDDFGADFFWGDEVQLSNPTSSDAAGFWQNILFAGNWPGCNVDGAFGPNTHSRTVSFQTGMLGYTSSQADGIVDPGGSNTSTWYRTQFLQTTGAQPFYRLIDDGGDNWRYYGGGAADAVMLWTGPESGGTWKWQHPVSGTWHTTSKGTDNVPNPC